MVENSFDSNSLRGGDCSAKNLLCTQLDLLNTLTKIEVSICKNEDATSKNPVWLPGF